MIVDCAAYRRGVRVGNEIPIAEIHDWLAQPETVVWLGLRSPGPDEIETVSRVFSMHPLAAEDVLAAHSRAKFEVFEDSLVVVLRTAHVEDDDPDVHLGELAILAGAQFVVTIRHGDASPLSGVRAELEADPERLAGGSGAILHAIVDRVVDDYLPVVSVLDEGVAAAEREVFSDSRHYPTQPIYRLMREVLEFEGAIEPSREPLLKLSRGVPGLVPADQAAYFRDVLDHMELVDAQVDRLRSLLAGALEANLTQVSIRQNEDMRKISAWVAIAAVPTMVAGVYGMNFEHMPELSSEWGYPAVLGVMASACGVMYRSFRRSGWL